MPKFEVVSEYQPAGDQPEAIAALSRGLEMGLDEQTLLGHHSGCYYSDMFIVLMLTYIMRTQTLRRCREAALSFALRKRGA